MNEDEMDGYIFCFIIFVQVVNLSSGQLIPREELRNVTTCDKTIVDVSCGNTELIAIHSLYFYYHPTCDSMCCGYDSNHFSSGADESFISEDRRRCSGRNICSLGQLDDVRDFGAASTQESSYVVIKYYCIPALRTTSICSTAKLTSKGDPLYITNENSPFETTGNSTCSCSLEVTSCTSSVNLYIMDADLYLDEGACEQTINFVDGTSTSLAQINCNNYYRNKITEINIDTNYVKINFIDNSVANQEGYFFLGFGVSEDVDFTLSCSYEEQTVCADCGTPYDISNGKVTLVVNGSTGFGARAQVICDEGFKIKGLCAGTQFQCGDGTCIDNSLRCDNLPDCDDKLDELLCDGQKSCLEGQVLCGTMCIDSQSTCDDAGTISCLVIGKWEIVKCSAKDCGAPPIVTGTTVTTSSGNLESSIATYVCEEGYTHISGDLQRTCRSGGTWSGTLPVCTPDCGSPARLDNGNISLASVNMTSVGATAEVLCDIGHNASALSIRCLTSGQWETVRCTLIDCGKPHNIDYGSVTLLKPLSTTYSSLASVTCQEGYQTSKQIIVCKETGSWESSSCDSEVDETPILIILVSVLSTLLLVVMITFGLYVFWRHRKRQRKRKSSQEVNTYEEVIRHGEQHQYSDIAMETQQ